MFLKELLFPKICLGCGYLGMYICPNCQKNLRYVEKDLCLYCQRASYFGLTHPGCKRSKGIDGGLSVFYYNNSLKKIIKTIKYRLANDVWKELYQIIKPEKLKKINFYKQLDDDFFLQPVPLHEKKLKERGFNQAQIITNFFHQLLGFPMSDLLVRTKDTKPQAQLSQGKKRYLNIRGAFSIKKEVKNKQIILIDDVITTGSTIKEAANVLKRHGAKKVFALTIAKG